MAILVLLAWPSGAGGDSAGSPGRDAEGLALGGERLLLEPGVLSFPEATLDRTVSTTRDRVTLQADVLFAFGSARLTGAARARVQGAAATVRERGPAAVRVVGYTDAKGGPAFNLALSRRRAEAVRRRLVGLLGDAAPPLKSEGRGEADPVARNSRETGGDDPQGRARNRRVELLLR